MSHKRGQTSTPDSPKRGQSMTSEQYLAKLQSFGFTIIKRGETYLTLKGRDGEITGAPNPDALTIEQAAEEMDAFLRRNGLLN